MIDVLVIGSGGAGLTAALKAKELGSKVLVVSKTYPTHSQTCQAQGGINAVLKEDEQDSVENYINDTYKASHKLGKIENIKLFCEKSKETITWLDSIGVPFSRDANANIAQRKFGGTKAKRTCYSSDYTGLKILHTLYDQCIKNSIDFLNEHLLLELLVKDSKVNGAIFLNIENSKIIQIETKSIILATGGYAGVYHQCTTNSYSSTGDGIAAAYKAGAKLSNMEFIQFHPTSLEGKNILISESARGEGGYLVDSKEQRFIDELRPRDEVARAIYKKQHQGDKIYLDLRHLGLEKIEAVMPQERKLVYDFMKLKMEKDLIPVSPSAHYTMGGILTTIDAKTTLENLYACGECAQSGIHGANRLGGNSLLEIVTFGKIAGENAAKNSKNKETFEVERRRVQEIEKELEEILKKECKTSFYSTKNELGKLFFNNVGLFREKKKMQKALDYLENKKEEIENFGIADKSKIHNKNLIELLEFKNIYLIAQLIVKSALKREESRGAHYRVDFENEKETFDKISISLKKEENIDILFEEIV
ncbi:succinate dehydrogenase [Halarcobacter ebronensis]|uniref:Succinate dehydrogenase n=1 Tax=Halarcobacter ebronensis TaxID=1462615 RepID=A0A4Q0YDR9_9BACT|nr:FAD-dependent oxidoreductase [Halarcobacter ebronensis]RXJ68620.1 succinate dehydrogenase [Halarcobacter ebronensis]